jgi:hypothetical protein
MSVLSRHDNAVYSVFVGGTEVNDFYLTHEQAEDLADDFYDDGYDDVEIIKVWER